MKTILCVDDHRASLSTLALILRGAGYRCLTAEEFYEAERLFASNSVDLVIVDHGIARMDGTQIAAHLKNIRTVAVLMLTGNTELSRKPKSVDLLLSKPQPPEHLLREIASLLHSGETIR